MKINAIGVWSMRILLVLGAVVSGCLGREEVSGGCVLGLVMSFVFLDADD